MSSLLDTLLELLALKDAIKKELEKPLNDSILSIIYEIKPQETNVNLEKMLKDYNAKDLLDLVKAIRENRVKKWEKGSQ